MQLMKIVWEINNHTRADYSEMFSYKTGKH